MCNENKCVILWLEVQAEIVLDKLTNDVLLVWTLTKSHSSLWLGLNFSCSSWARSRGIPPGHQTHSSFLPSSHNSVTGPCKAWPQGHLAGLHHGCRGFDSVVQPLVSGSLCDAPLFVCASLRQLGAALEGEAGTWSAVGCAPCLPAHWGSLRHGRAFWRAPKPIFGQLNHALGVSHSSKLQQAWMWMWIGMLHYGLWLKVEYSATLAFQKQKIRFHSGIYQGTGANM